MEEGMKAHLGKPQIVLNCAHLQLCTQVRSI